MLQFIPALILLLMQSAPADRGSFALDWYTLHALRAELHAPAVSQKLIPALKLTRTSRIGKASAISPDCCESFYEPVILAAEGSRDITRSRDGPGTV